MGDKKETVTLDFDSLDYMYESEIKSLLKSNRISWNTRRLVKVYLAHRKIRELVPIIAVTVIGNTIMGILKNER